MSGKYAFTKGLKELRFLHCQTSEHSNAVRSFLTRAYPTMKHHNPHTPIMIREALNVKPRVYARYEYGREKYADLKGLDDKAIEDKVTSLVKDGQ
ncbi:NADH dehydrogenase, alpha subcomplex, subunit 2 [Teratosphaeria nubilosa]|uniref:NADH dehydrogenase, alpha subcomplex, subunit 2 n=1 Tax=Teratosphaeria nubilosa TaxID=161662 RepID=A0A6G1LLW1_9PEZI|nr:NADH dehydrogenase, alpha subcomplex, subunit 2 [Teratosphaeria nubilosa]